MKYLSNPAKENNKSFIVKLASFWDYLFKAMFKLKAYK
jgi:hypothetical protein